MGNFFTNIGGMLKGGFNVLGSTWGKVKQGISYGGEFFQDKFFPQAQKTTITPSIVSRQPYTTFKGVRQTAQEAATITPFYKRWWNSSKAKAVNIGGSIKNWFGGMNIRKEKTKTINVLASSVGKTVRSAISTLPDYFANKWGLVSRGDSGDKAGNLPNQPQKSVIYYNPTQSRQAATSSGSFDFWDLLRGGSQPKGEFNMAFPQSEGAPTMIPYPISAPQEARGKQNMGSILTAPNMIMFAALGIGLYFVIKKGGKR